MAEAICLEPLTVETVFDPGLVHLKSVVQRIALGQSFFPSSLVVHCHSHGTNALYSF